jgi:hypothetical protein
MLRRIFAPILLVLALWVPVHAAVDLVTMPARDGTQLTIYNSNKLVSGKPVPAKIEVERQFDANVVLWGEAEPPKGGTSNEAGAYVDLHNVAGRVERVDQQHVKYFMDLKPGRKERIDYNVTYKRRKIGPELNAQRKREPL